MKTFETDHLWEAVNELGVRIGKLEHITPSNKSPTTCEKKEEKVIEGALKGCAWNGMEWLPVFDTIQEWADSCNLEVYNRDQLAKFFNRK